MHSLSDIKDIPLKEGHVRFFHMTNSKRNAFDIHALGLNFERYPNLGFKAFGPFKTADEAKLAHLAHRNTEGVWKDAWILYFDVPEALAEDFYPLTRKGQAGWTKKYIINIVPPCLAAKALSNPWIPY